MTIPVEDVPVPDVVRRIAAGRSVARVWAGRYSTVPLWEAGE